MSSEGRKLSSECHQECASASMGAHDVGFRMVVTIKADGAPSTWSAGCSMRCLRLTILEHSMSFENFDVDRRQ